MTWSVSAISSIYGGKELHGTWYGPSDSTFSIVESDSESYATFVHHSICGDIFSYCFDTFSSNVWYIQTSTGDCARTLGCSSIDATYNDLSANIISNTSLRNTLFKFREDI